MPPAPTRYTDPRAHELRDAYLATFGGDEIPVPVEAIAEDLLGLLVEQRDLGECSGMLIPAKRLVVVNTAEGASDGRPTARQRFTIAHELGHWICHARRGADPSRSYCRASDLALDVDRALEREANVFGAELLMPEPAVREAWAASPDRDALAARFGVSALAAQWRLHSFGLGHRPA